MAGLQVPYFICVWNESFKKERIENYDVLCYLCCVTFLETKIDHFVSFSGTEKVLPSMYYSTRNYVLVFLL